MGPTTIPLRAPGKWIPYKTSKDRIGFQGTLPSDGATALLENEIALSDVMPYNAQKMDKKQFDVLKQKFPNAVGHGAKPYRLDNIINFQPSPVKYNVELIRRVLNGKMVPTFKVSKADSALVYATIPCDLPDTPKPICQTGITLEQLGETIRQICEHAVGDLNNVNKATRWAIRDAALKHHGLGPGDVDMCIAAAHHSESRGKHYYRNKICALDRTMPIRKAMWFKIDASRIDDTVPIPKVPEGLRLTVGGWDDQRPATLRIPESVTPEERVRHQRAADLANYIAYLFTGSYGHKHDTRRRIRAFKSSFLLPVARKRENADVAYVSRAEGFAIIRPKTWVLSLFPELPKLYIRSPTRLRTYGTMQAIIEEFERGGHLLDVWLRGAEAADVENHRIDLGTRVAQTARCDKTDGWHRHPCHTCDAQPLCFTMFEVPELNIRVCCTCSKRPVRELTEGGMRTLRRGPLTSLPVLVRTDYKKAGRLAEDYVGERRSIVHQGRERLLQQRIAGGWRDRYCLRDIDDSEVPAKQRLVTSPCEGTTKAPSTLLWMPLTSSRETGAFLARTSPATLPQPHSRLIL
ncbi:hypothetical protein GGR51DRAFT_15148 [Nemania sp. FL0031]|nr:hypothetical protein GGR51DRAFT_15148 [Nemania sp. FL0031]